MPQQLPMFAPLQSIATRLAAATQPQMPLPPLATPLVSPLVSPFASSLALQHQLTAAYMQPMAAAQTLAPTPSIVSPLVPQPLIPAAPTQPHTITTADNAQTLAPAPPVAPSNASSASRSLAHDAAAPTSVSASPVSANSSAAPPHTITPTGDLAPDQYQCKECGTLHSVTNKPHFANGRIRRFLASWSCGTCIDNIKQRATTIADKADREELNWVKYTCIEHGCRDHDKVWSGPRAHQNWLRHYKTYHVDVASFMNCMQLAVCRGEHCIRTVPIDTQKCTQCAQAAVAMAAHVSAPQNIPVAANGDQAASGNAHARAALGRDASHAADRAADRRPRHAASAGAADGGVAVPADGAAVPADVPACWRHVDSDGRVLDLRRVLQLTDVEEHYTTDEQRSHAANSIMRSLFKCAKGGNGCSHADEQRALEGALEIRLYAAAHHFIPYRDDVLNRKIEIHQRRGLFEKKQWTRLVDRIEYVQRRREQRKRRQKRRAQAKAHKPDGDAGDGDVEMKVPARADGARGADGRRGGDAAGVAHGAHGARNARARRGRGAGGAGAGGRKPPLSHAHAQGSQSQQMLSQAQPMLQPMSSESSAPSSSDTSCPSSPSSPPSSSSSSSESSDSPSMIPPLSAVALGHLSTVHGATTRIVSPPRQARIHQAELIDLDRLAKDIDELKFDTDKTDRDLARRLKRCHTQAKRGRMRKADRALDECVIADLSRDSIRRSLLSKFPTEQPLQISDAARRLSPKWRLEPVDVRDHLVANLNRAACGGPCGHENELLAWALVRDEQYGISVAFNNLLKAHIEKGLVSKVNTLLTFAKGVAFRKPNKDDVRPITIFDSVLRIVDNLALLNTNPADRRAAVGPFQCVDLSQGCEIATIVADHCHSQIGQIRNECIVSEDIHNAFNTVSRQRLLDDIVEKLPDLYHHFLAIYGQPNQINFASDGELQTITMETGVGQGLATSVLLYGMAKYTVHKEAMAEMNRRHSRPVEQKQQQEQKQAQAGGFRVRTSSDFVVDAQADYVDDGIQLTQLRYVLEYLEVRCDRYVGYGMHPNWDKTKIVLLNYDPALLDALLPSLTSKLKRENIRTDGNFEFLGVPHGDDAYVNQIVHRRLDRVEKKVKVIELLRNKQIKSLLYKKFLTYNKIIYTLKTTRACDSWLARCGALYTFIQRSLTAHMTPSNTTSFQLQMTDSEGGLGLRNATLLYHAARTASLGHKEHLIRRFFSFHARHADPDDDADAADNAVDPPPPSRPASQPVADLTPRDVHDAPFLTAFYKYEATLQDELNKGIETLNAWLGPEHAYDLSMSAMGTIHRDIVALIDNKLRDDAMNAGTDRDRARLLSLQVAGASTWLTVPPNPFFGVEFNNLEHHHAMCIRFGSPITARAVKCARCGETCDRYGYHALHCQKGNFVVWRHDTLRDALNAEFRRAGYITKIEQRWKDPDHDPTSPRVDPRQVPGDIKCEGFCPDGALSKDAYFDIVVGNIFADTYLPYTSKSRLWLAKEWEWERTCRT